jgi:hypothetical protein
MVTAGRLIPFMVGVGEIEETAQMIEKAGNAAWPDRVGLGLRFSTSGTAVMARTAGWAGLRAALGYDTRSRAVTMPAAAASIIAAPE